MSLTGGTAPCLVFAYNITINCKLVFFSAAEGFLCRPNKVTSNLVLVTEMQLPGVLQI